MGNITEIVEESTIQLEIIELGGGQIEIVDNPITQLEVIESGSSINPLTLDITPQINTVVVGSISENTTIDIMVSDPITIETVTTNNVIEIVEDQVVYQTGSIYNSLYYPTTESITNNFITQSISQSTTIVNGDTVINGGLLIESGGLFQSVTQSGNDFTPTQISELLHLLFNEGTISLTVDKSSFEKNLTTSITFNYTVSPNSNTISTATFDTTDVTNNPNNSQNYTDVLNTISKTYNVTFAPTSSGGNSRSTSKTISSTARDPQYCGVSTIESFNGYNYENLNNILTKKVQSGDSISQTTSPTNQYVYFLSINDNATITDGNGFNNTSDFTKTTITVKYANTSDQTLYQYRTTDIKTLTSFTYNIT